MDSQDRLMRGAAAAAIALFVGAGVALAAPGVVGPSHPAGGAAIVITTSTETAEPSETAEPTETAEPSEKPEPSLSVRATDKPEPTETAEPTDKPEPSETAEPTKDGQNGAGDQAGGHDKGQDGPGQNDHDGDQGGND